MTGAVSQVPVSETTTIDAPVCPSDTDHSASEHRGAIDAADNGNHVRQAAEEMIAAGYSPIPVPFGQKAPHLKEWQKLRITSDTLGKYFTGVSSNLGLLLGEPSQDCVDVDLDCAEAIGAADLFLPRTEREHGRPSTPRSHRWYSVSPAPKTKQFEDPDGKTMLVELRSTGAQTIVPPSVHPSGETLVWHSTGMPTVVEATELERAVAELAACAMLARRWTLHIRHKTSMALAGMLLRAGWSEERTVAFIRAVATVANDEELDDRLGNVAATAERLAAGEAVTGGTTLAELLPEGKQVVTKLRKWLALGPQVTKPSATTNGADTAAQPTGGAIKVGTGSLALETAAVWRAIHAANDPPQFFRHGRRPVRIETDDVRVPVVVELTPDRLRHHLARFATFTNDKDRPVPPPLELVKDVLATPNMPLPILHSIVETPVFAADGSLPCTPGYHRATRAYYMPPDGLQLPMVPDAPTADDVARARALILDDLLVDFPFVDQAERAAAVGLLILPFVRRLIAGPTPLHLIEKPAPGTGGSLLAEVITYVATGRTAAVMTEARGEEEWRKRITSTLMDGRAVVLIDNLRNRLDSAALSAAITAPIWQDRVLGVSQNVRLPVECTWIATGNNPSLSTEMMRRTVRIRMDARIDHPWLRKTELFKHPNLMEWIESVRGELIWAVLVLGRAWIAAGRPDGTKTLGMFERWARVIGGILTTCGIGGFLENLAPFYDVADDESIAIRAFIATWWREHASLAVAVPELLLHADGLELGAGSEHSRATRLGALLRRCRDRRFDKFRIEIVGKAHRANRWALVAEPCPTCNLRCWVRNERDDWVCADCQHKAAETR